MLDTRRTQATGFDERSAERPAEEAPVSGFGLFVQEERAMGVHSGGLGIGAGSRLVIVLSLEPAR